MKTNTSQTTPFAPTLAAVIVFVLLGQPQRACADPADDLAAKLSAVQSGTSFVRLRMKVENPGGRGSATLQIQIKERRSGASADVLYQILFPKERKGESVLLNQVGGGTPTGQKFELPDRVTAVGRGNLETGLFGGDLALQDVIENFFAWGDQKIVGTEVVDGVECQILESKPAGGQWSAYGSVRSWIDPKRTVPLRVEKYDDGGRMVRRIETKRVYKNDNGHYIPATLVIRREGSGSVTELEGSRSKVGVGYTDEDFAVKKMTDLSPPR